jgi:DNA-binding FadR family transcriptional regulator
VTGIHRRPLAEQAVEVILARIGAGEWPLGHKLPGETTLATTLGVGRSTVREAIRELSGKGVLDSRQGAGVFVTALEPREDWDGVLRRADIVSVIEARIAIEVEAACLAAERRTRADLSALRQRLAERAAVSDDVAALVDADTAFHRAVIVAAHNDILTELFDSFVPRIRSAMVDMLRLKPMADAHGDHLVHAGLVDALLKRDARLASELSRSHLSGMRGAFLSAVAAPLA